MDRTPPSYATAKDAEFKRDLNAHLLGELEKQSPVDIVNDFSKYAARQHLTRFIARADLFRMISNIRGSIAELGVNSGSGLMAWAQLSAILEPVGGMFRHIYGFDTFEGFPSVHANDKLPGSEFQWQENDLTSRSFDDLIKCIGLFDKNRVLGQIPKVTLVKGDFNKTAPTFLETNKHVLFSLLYLDFDLYEPTATALKHFLPRCGKGSIIAFDEINHPLWPGETLALLEHMEIQHSTIQCFNYEPNISYIKIGH